LVLVRERAQELARPWVPALGRLLARELELVRAWVPALELERVLARERAREVVRAWELAQLWEPAPARPPYRS
jgi:hypothetical protein